ncbi:MAG: PilC/PilY family type IV pilus protein [Luteibacter sp.]
MTLTKSLRSVPLLATLLACLSASPVTQLHAQTTTYYTVDLSAAPPDLTVGVAPNIAVTFDDSGSMGASNLPDTLDSTGGKKYYYSSNTNSQYYNPNIVYTPPLQPDGQTRFTQYSYTSAPRDGICATLGTCTANTVDLSSAFRTGFYTYTNSGVVANAYGGNNISSKLAGDQDGGFYYTCPTVGSETNCAITLMSAGTKKQRQNFANWYSYYRTRNLMTRSAISNVFSTLGSSIRVVYQNLNDSKYMLKAGKTTFDAFAGTARSNFFTWLYQVINSGGTPGRTAVYRAGEIFKSGQGITDNTNPYWEPNIGDDSKGMELSCRLNYSLLVTDGYWNGGDPGLPATTAQNSLKLPDGTVYSGANGDAESKIFWNVPSTDYGTMGDLGFNYWATNLRPDFKKADGTTKLDVPPSWVDYTDQNGVAVTWDGTGVPPKSLYFNPANDPATWPHVVQYMITLGIDGSLDYPGDSAALRDGTKAWPKPSNVDNGNLTDIDDTWHGAVNSRGQYFSARDPDALSSALNQLLTRIIARSTSAVAGALSSSVLTGDSVTYLTGFDSSSWSGSFVARPVDVQGNVGATNLWSAGDQLTARAKAGDTRIILTSSAAGSGNGAAFTWTAIGSALKGVDANFTDTNGDATIKYLRGDTSKEGTTYRRRVSTLGAIVNSQPVYVAYPASGYRDSFPNNSDGTVAPEMAVDGTGALKHSYAQFVSDNNDRAPTLYVGANDGMLHAFDATTGATGSGAERWAYVPRSVWGKLFALTPKSGFTYAPTVDATPVERDVFFSTGSNQGWHSILVGGLRFGGRGVYALDVTDPTALESSPNSKVLWEFNSDATGGANLGYTFGKPNIGRLSNGKWVVLVPSGYFPDKSTDAAAANTTSSLFVLDAQTGAIIKELKTPTTVTGVTGTVVSYGLSSPVLGDYNNDQIDDVAFAGDLQGNLWRFDLSNSDPSNWAVNLLYRPSSATSGDPAPGDQPITVMPRLFADPTSSNFIVLFGTGKYLGATDNSVSGTLKTQSVYGIRDPGTSTFTPIIGRSALIAQTMAESNNIRALTNRPVPAKDAGGNAIRGWYFDLYTGTSTAQTNKGERVVVDATALFDSGRAIVTTLIPGSTDPCAPVRKGAVLVVDAATGGAASGVSVGSASFANGFSQAGARVTNVPVTGGLPAATSIGGGNISLPGVNILNKDSSTGGVFSFGDAIWRRRSWRELNNVY